MFLLLTVLFDTHTHSGLKDDDRGSCYLGHAGFVYFSKIYFSIIIQVTFISVHNNGDYVTQVNINSNSLI